jgi:hypothetical protein
MPPPASLTPLLTRPDRVKAETAAVTQILQIDEPDAPSRIAPGCM